MARVWIGQCADELDNKAEARRIWEALAAEKNPAAEEAARIGSLLALRHVAEDRQASNRADQVPRPSRASKNGSRKIMARRVRRMPRRLATS